MTYEHFDLTYEEICKTPGLYYSEGGGYVLITSALGMGGPTNDSEFSDWELSDKAKGIHTGAVFIPSNIVQGREPRILIVDNAELEETQPVWGARAWMFRRIDNAEVMLVLK